MITGRLEDRPLARVLQDLHTERFTGELVVHARAGLIQVYVREGYPVYVNLPENSDLLGRILCEMQVLDDSALRRSLATPPEPGQRYGDVLLRLGLCDDTTLKHALRAQVRRKLHRLFAITEGGFAAVPGDHARGLQGGESLRVHPRRVIFQAATSFASERLRSLTRELLQRALRLQQHEQDSIGRYGFGPEEIYVVELLRRGYWVIPELIEVAGYEPQRTLAALYALWVTDALEVADEDAAPRARDHITDLPPPPPAGPKVVDLPIMPARRDPTPAPIPAPAPSVVRPASTRGTSPSVPVMGGAAAAKPPSRPVVPAAPPSRPSGSIPLPPSRPGIAPRPTSLTGEIPKLELERPGHKPGAPGSKPGTPGAAPGSGAPGAGAPGSGAPGSKPGGGPRSGIGLGSQPAQTGGKRPVSFEEMALLRADIENKSKVVDDETLFAVLGVPQTADVNAVKAAFLAAAKKYHPDRIVAIGMQAMKDQADKIFRRVNEAHSVLSDPAKRDEYVAELRMKEASGDKSLKEKELAVKAVNAELAFSRGTVFFRRRDYASAAREFEEALRLKPDEGEHLGYLAWCRFCAGQCTAAEALKDLSQALRQTKEEAPRLYYFAGILYKQEDKEDRALQSFHKAVELDERIEEARTEIRLIESRRTKKTKSPSSESKGGGKGKPSSASQGSSASPAAGAERKMSFLERLRQPLNKKK